MSLTTTEEKQLSFSFKALINKEFTSTSKTFYEEFGTQTLNTNTSEVWSSDISATPSTAVNDGVARLYTDFVLSPMLGYGTEAFYFASGSGWTPGDDVDRPTINENLLQRNFISTKYGGAYDVQLKENNGTVINTTDPIGWQFDYQTGILTIENPGGKSTPYKITVYQYTGQFLSQSLGGGSGIFEQTGSFFATTNDLQVTGSFNATSITGSLTGSLEGIAATASYVAGASVDGAVATASYVAGANVDGAVATASYVAGANVDGAVANATNAATAAALATDATGTNLTLSGNLSVAGTASFTNATNLAIKDKYILLSSGSTSAGDGGIVVQQAAGGEGKLFGYDSNEGRWAITSSFDADSAADFQPDAYVSMVISGSAISEIPALYNQKGNMFVDSSNDAWIYTDKWSKLIVSGSAAEFSSIIVSSSADIQGTLSLPNISDVSASLAIALSQSSAPSAGFPFVGDAEITGSLIVSGSTAIPIQASGQSINIGQPADANAYGNGFFDTFTSATSLAQSMDEISKAFLDLAPAKALTLGGTNLVLSNATDETGKLAYNMTGFGYYNGFSGGSSISFTNDPTYNLSTATTGTRFRAGKFADFSPSNVLEGGVSSSISFRGAAASIETHALSAGTNPTPSGKIELTSLSQYETFWMKANARIVQSIAADATGSYKYQLLADNGAGSTNFTDLAFVGANGSTFNPTPTVSPASIAGNASGQITSGSVTYRYMSGVEYLKTATFNIPMTAENMFLPVYQENNVKYNSTTFFSSDPVEGTTGADQPNFNDSLSNTTVVGLKPNVISGITAPTCTVSVFKPAHTTVTSPSVTLSNTPVQSFSADQSGNNETFRDETQRLEQDYSTAWSPSAVLTNGNAQTRNGIILSANAGNISPASINNGSGYTGFSGRQYWIRKFTGFPTGRVSGTYSLTGTFSSISAWGSGGDLEVLLIDTFFIAGGSPSQIYDLGRAAGTSNDFTGAVVPGNNNVPNGYGITSGTVGNLNGNWSLAFVNGGTNVKTGDFAMVISIASSATANLSSATMTVI